MGNPGSANQHVLRLPLSYLGTASPLSVETGDIAFVTSREGFLLFGDTIVPLGGYDDPFQCHGFAHEDTNVMLLLSNPSFEPKEMTGPVQTAQVAPTILKAFGLSPNALQVVQKDNTSVLPGLDFGE